MAIIFDTYGSLPTITLENDKVKAVFLPSKGADLLEFIHINSATNAFYRTQLPIDAYSEIDLHCRRLGFHSEKLLGGYMNLLPHRGLHKGKVLEQNEGGIAATLPWEYDILENSSSQLKIKFYVLLPIFPLYAKRTCTLKTGETFLRIEDCVENASNEEILFTWTQHALFGKEILDEDTTIKLPSKTIFKAWEHAKQPYKKLEAFNANPYHVQLKQGIFDLSKPLKAGNPDYEFVVFKNLNAREVSICNQTLKLDFFFRWDIERFPYLRAVYKHGDDGPMVGLEPSNDMFSGWEHSQRYQTYTRLTPQASIVTSFQLGFR